MTNSALLGSLVSNGNNVDILGHVIWPELESIDTTAEWFGAKLVELGFDESYARQHNYRSTFQRCLKNLESKRIIRRVHEDDNRMLYQFTQERLNEDEDRLEYTTETQIEVDKMRYYANHDFRKAMVRGDDAIRDRLAEMFEKEKSRYTTNDVSRYIKKILREETDMVSIRRQGSVYFVPASGQEVVNRITQLLQMITNEGKGVASMGHFPLVDSSASRQQVSDNVEAEVLAVLSNMQEEMAQVQSDDVTDRWVNHRLDKINEVKGRIDMYAKVLGDKQDQLTGRADVILGDIKRTLDV